MPVQPCTTNGQPGRRWGQQGKCYPCSRSSHGWDCTEAERRAKAQGRAVEGK